MGNWASTLAKEDAMRTRYIVIFVSVTIAVGMLLICAAGALAYTSRKNRQTQLESLEADLDLESFQKRLIAMQSSSSHIQPTQQHYQQPVSYIIQQPQYQHPGFTAGDACAINITRY